MLTIVVYVLATLVVAAALFALSVVVFGRGELLPAVDRRHTVTALPDTGIAGDDLRSVRFGMAARGYTMAEVDWVLDHAAEEIDRLRARLGEPASSPSPSQGPAESHEVGNNGALPSRGGATR